MEVNGRRKAVAVGVDNVPGMLGAAPVEVENAESVCGQEKSAVDSGRKKRVSGVCWRRKLEDLSLL